MTRRGSGFVTAFAVGLAALASVSALVAGCSSSSDDPPSDSILAEVQRALCDSGSDVISVGGTVYSLEDCPDGP